MTTKHWIGVMVIWATGVMTRAEAQVQPIGRVHMSGQVRRATHCDTNCSDLGPLWASASCDGSCNVVPTIPGPAYNCGGCGMVLGDFVCNVKNGIDRTMRCFLGALLPCGMCDGNYDVCSSVACSGGSGSCAMTCCDGGCAGGCDGGCTGGCAADFAPSYDGAPYGAPSEVAPQPIPQPAVADPFRDDPPAPAPVTNSARLRSGSPAPTSQAHRLSPQKRTQVRRTTFQKSMLAR